MIISPENVQTAVQMYISSGRKEATKEMHVSAKNEDPHSPGSIYVLPILASEWLRKLSVIFTWVKLDPLQSDNSKRCQLVNRSWTYTKRPDLDSVRPEQKPPLD